METIVLVAVRRIAAVVAVLLFAACSSREPGPTLAFPERDRRALGGDEFAEILKSLEPDLEAREARILEEVESGNVPIWSRELVPVEVTGPVGGETRTLTVQVTTDYLAVGDDDDYLLVPLTPQTAQRVADLVHASLPTPAIVDAIWEGANYRMTPIRLPAGRAMKSARYFERHNRLILGQRKMDGERPRLGRLAAGHKLDVVLTPGIAERPGTVSLYGWHQEDGTPIQPLITEASDRLVVFSHGVRLVSRDVWVDGEPRDLRDVLLDPELATILSEGGVIDPAHYPTEPGGWTTIEERLEGSGGGLGGR